MSISYASIISVIVSTSTVISSLFSTKIIAKLGTAKVTAISTSLTVIALFGFSYSQNFFWLCICAIPLGVGAGSIDTALNNYVALYYNAMQVNFLHCFYGIGVTISPYLMFCALSESMNWKGGYRTVFCFQIAIATLSILSLLLWEKIKERRQREEMVQVLPLYELFKRKKIWASCGVFVGICALESTCLVWGSTYLSEAIGLSADKAAAMITFYFAGMTIGRFFFACFPLNFLAGKLLVWD